MTTQQLKQTSRGHGRGDRFAAGGRRALADAVAHAFRDLEHFETGPFAKQYQRLRGVPAYEVTLTQLRTAVRPK
jgi:hypothetical protein